MNWLKRIFSLEPAAVMSTASAVYIAVQMVYRSEFAHEAVFQPDLIVAAVTAVWGLWTRIKVTPLGRPRDRYGNALVPRDQTVRPSRM